MLCPYCQEEIKDGAIKCKHCKSELTPNAQTVECGNAGSVMFPMRRFNQCLRLFVFIVPMCFAVFFIDFDNDIAGTIVQLIMCAGILLFTWILASMCLYRGESGVQIDGDNVSIYFPIIKSEVLNFRFDDIEQCTLSKKDIVISMEKPKLRITNSGSSNVNSIFLFSAFLKDKDTHFSLTIDRELFSKTVFENIKQIILARGAKIGFPIYDNSNMTLLERIEKWSNENPTSANYIRFAILAGGLLATHHFWR